MLARDADIVLVEGAGSPAEINLRSGDIANMGFAAAADVPVVLLGDIDRGGVIASLVGTHAVLEPDERARIHGFIVNKFRGDVGLFDDGLTAITRTYRLALARRGAVVAAGARGCRRRMPSISTAPMLHPRRVSSPCRCSPASPISTISIRSGMEPGVKLVFVRPGEPIPGDAEIVILPGSKSTIGDLAFLRAQGWDIDIISACPPRRPCARTVRRLSDARQDDRRSRRRRRPRRHRRRAGSARCRDRDDAATRSTDAGHGHASRDGCRDRRLRDPSRPQRGPGLRRGPVLDIGGRADGAGSRDGRVQGTYVHGLFTGDAFRKAWLARFRHRVVAGLRCAASKPRWMRSPIISKRISISSRS